jgi:hypothetical protein
MRTVFATLAVAAAAAAPSATPAHLAAPAPVTKTVASQSHFQAYSRNPNGSGGFMTQVAAEHHDHSTHVHAEPKPAVAKPEQPVPVRRSTARPVAAPGAMFRTPEAAMRYLAAAYTNHDLKALKHVTTPDARSALEDMRGMASDLHLVSCDWRAEFGTYSCRFSHHFPTADAASVSDGVAWFDVAPAARPGWYMTVMESCN